MLGATIVVLDAGTKFTSVTFDTAKLGCGLLLQVVRLGCMLLASCIVWSRWFVYYLHVFVDGVPVLVLLYLRVALYMFL